MQSIQTSRFAHFGILAIFTLIAWSTSSCHFSKPPQAEKSDEKTTQAPKLVGRIASIPADKRFVLIQSYGKWEMENLTVLTTRGPDGRTANLLVTGESLGHFAAADLQSGTVEVGDAVYSRHVPKPEEAAPPPIPPASPSTAPAPTESPNPPLEALPETELPKSEPSLPNSKILKNN